MLEMLRCLRDTESVFNYRTLKAPKTYGYPGSLCKMSTPVASGKGSNDKLAKLKQIITR